MVSTTVETANPEAEIQPGLNLLGPIKNKFVQVSNNCLVFNGEATFIQGCIFCIGSPAKGGGVRCNKNM